MAQKSGIRGVRIGAESKFGSVSATTGLVDVSGVTFIAAEFDHAGLVDTGEQEMVQPDQARGGYHMVPPEPVTRWSGGSRVEHRAGATLTLTQMIRGLGYGASGITTLADMPHWKLLRTVMADAGEPVAASDAVSADYGETRHTPTTLASFANAEGELIATDLDGVVQAAQITDVTTDILYSPAVTNAADVSQVFYLLRTLVLDRVIKHSLLGPTVAAQVEGDGWRTLCTGGRVSNIRIFPENGVVKIELAVTFAHAQDASADADVVAGTNIDTLEPVRTDGAELHYRQVRTVISAETPTSAPATLASTEVNLDNWELSIGFTLHPRGTGGNLIGFADYEVADPVIELTLEPSDEALDALVANDLLDRVRGRTICIPFAPLGAGDGGALLIPCAVLKSDPRPRDLAGPLVRTPTLSYGAGRNTCVDATTVQGKGLVYFAQTRGT